MGYNRAGDRRKARMKRAKRLEARLAARETKESTPPAPTGENEPHGLLHKVQDLAKGAVEKVGEAIHAATEKIKGAVS